MSYLLILTNSYDCTTDLLLDRLNGLPVFRLNFDQITNYRIRLSQNGFEISDPVGRTVTNKTVSKVYWRKPFNAESENRQLGTDYVDSELRYLLTEIVNFLWTDNKLVLVEPFAERRVGKLMQLRHADGLFDLPEYEFVLNVIPSRDCGVVKSLSNQLVDGKVLYTTGVQTEELDLRYPWFVEQYVSATDDVTAVFVRGRIFGFAIERNFLGRTVDWRECINENQTWRAHPLPRVLSDAICSYMQAIRLDFGRFDFLLDNQQRYWFCEVNPNGQFAWLDLQGSHGVLDAVVNEISPATERHPIANPHPMRSRTAISWAHSTTG